MANLPSFIVIKPVIFETYACYESETEFGHVYCKGKSVFNPFTKIALEQSKNNGMYYHLRFCHSNRYWAKSENQKWIAAVSKQPQEDTSLPSCTLFLPTIDDKGTALCLTHVQSGMRVHADSANTPLYVDEDTGRASDSYNFSYVDWENLVKIPNHVVFRGSNEKILDSAAYASTPLKFLQFGSTDGNDGYSAQEVSLQPDGHFRIKSEYYGQFWRRDYNNNWISGDSSDDSGKDKDTMFWPVPVGDSTIALRNAGNGMYVERLTQDGKTDCLNAASREISNNAKLVVEELVLESEVYNVRYRLEDARVFDEQLYLAGTRTIVNDSDTDSKSLVEVVSEVVDSFSCTRSISLKLGGETSFVCGFPFISEGKIEISIEDTSTRKWGEETPEKKTAVGVFTITVPAKSRAKVSYVGTVGKCSVPFSYTQRDKRTSDGKYVTSQHDDGIFYGTNYYSFRFEPAAIQPL